MLVLQPEPQVCGEVWLRNFCLWFQNLQSLMCGGVYWEMLQLLICRVVIGLYNCLFSRKSLPSQPSGFSAHCFLVFPAFITRRTFLNHQSFIIPLSQELGGVVVPFFLQLTSYTTDYPALHSQAIFSYRVLFRCITFLWSKIKGKNKHTLQTFFQILPAGVTAMTGRKGEVFFFSSL